jgi:hypothetical protein
MKYIAFLTALVLFVPIATLAAAYSRRIRVFVFGSLVFATAFTDWFDINFLERWWYAGTTRGIEFSFVDFLAFTLLFSSLTTMQRERARLYWPAGLAPMLVYLGVGCLSVLISDPRLFGFFELTKMVRGIIVFLAVAWFVRTERDAHVLVFALGAALACNGLYAVWQRYSGAMYRVHGTFPHENILGDYCVLVGPIVLAVGLSTLPATIRMYSLAAAVSGAVATVLTISRLPAALYLVTSVAVLATAHGTRMTPRKMGVALLIGVVFLGIFYRALDGLTDRQQATAAADTGLESGRSGHYLAGWKMVQDHPLGVGLNNWGWYFHEYARWAGTDNARPYQSTSEPGDGRATQGHTVYGLILGELGWPGILVFAVFMMRCLHMSGRFFFARESTIWSQIGVGCFFGFLAEFLANTTEITFRNQQIFIIFNVLLGFVAATLNRQHR